MKGLCNLIGNKTSFLGGFPPDLYQHHPSEWGMGKIFAEGNLLFIEPLKIMMSCILYGWTGWRERLHDHFPFCLAAAGPTRNLSQKLKSAFTGPEVRCMKPNVGIDDSDQRHIWKIQSLGYHLGADQDV